MQEQHEQFPDAFEAVLLIGLLMVLELVAWATVADAGVFSGVSDMNVSAFITVVGNGALFVGLMAYKRIRYRALFHPSRSSVASTLITVSAPILMLVPGLVLVAGAINSVVIALFPMSEAEGARFIEMMDEGVISFISGCVLAPVLEEMLFRGIILRSFLRRYSRTKAILLSSLLFGAAHMNLYQLATAFAIGIVAGWLYERCRSLWPCILLHAAYNGFVTFSYSAIVDAGGSAVTGIGVAFAAAIAGGLLLLRLLGTARANVQKR
jgi:membrane protease YdiL (CAAX protease family)